jgi:CBS domain-containing protein
VLVGELMSRSVARVHVATSLREAVGLLGERRVSALPVVDDEDRVVGILSEADVLALQTAADPRSRLRPPDPPSPWPEAVGAVMTPDPVVAHEGSDVAHVGQLMADTGWKSLPVVDDRGALVGMVSRSDVIRALATRDELIRDRVLRDLAQLSGRGWRVEVADGVVTVLGVETEPDGRLATAIASTAPGVRRVVIDGSVMEQPPSP